MCFKPCFHSFDASMICLRALASFCITRPSSSVNEKRVASLWNSALDASTVKGFGSRYGAFSTVLLCLSRAASDWYLCNTWRPLSNTDPKACTLSATLLAFWASSAATLFSSLIHETARRCHASHTEALINLSKRRWL